MLTLHFLDPLLQHVAVVAAVAAVAAVEVSHATPEIPPLFHPVLSIYQVLPATSTIQEDLNGK
jgi:hypothetical protein